MEARLSHWLPAGVIALSLLAGCADPGPAEQAGERIDQAAGETAAMVEEMTDN
jgi:hypothetical protein